MGQDEKKRPDHRTRVTKLLIRHAFTELLRQKPVQRISVRELCERAGINRGTFYTHYTDLYDLLRQVEDGMADQLARSVAGLLEDGAREVNTLQVLTGMFRCLKENPDICTVTLGPYGDKAFVERLLRAGKEWWLKSCEKQLQNAAPWRIESYYAFASAGCLGLLEAWMEQGMEESPEKLAGAAEQITVEGIRFLRAKE